MNAWERKAGRKLEKEHWAGISEDHLLLRRCQIPSIHELFGKVAMRLFLAQGLRKVASGRQCEYRRFGNLGSKKNWVPNPGKCLPVADLLLSVDGSNLSGHQPSDARPDFNHWE
jgi:hypothetical protein